MDPDFRTMSLVGVGHSVFISERIDDEDETPNRRGVEDIDRAGGRAGTGDGGRSSPAGARARKREIEKLHAKIGQLTVERNF